jgi:GMP synthase-like glutamine amidotransferase
MRILVLEHEPDAPPALLDDWARARAHELEVVAVPSLGTWPGPGDYGAVISLGSERSTHASPPPWVPRELELLRSAHASDVPVLGVCFGGQALAKALGGEVGRAANLHVEWCQINGLDRVIMPGPWFFWHEDRFTPPSDAQLLAHDPGQAIAFASRRSLGLQFHPEADEALVRSWLDGSEARLASRGIDLARLEEEIARFAPDARRRAFAQFDRIADWWARSGSRELAAR